MEGAAAMFSIDIVIAIVAAAIVGLLFALYGAQTFRSMKTSRRFKRLVGDDIDFAMEEIRAFDAVSDDNIEGFLHRILPSVQATQRRMLRAGIRISVRIYLLGIAFAALTLSMFISVPGIPASIAFVGNPLVIGFCLHVVNELVVLRFLRARYSARILKQLPDALDHIVRSLTVGQSLESAIRASIPAMQSPLADEMSMLNRLLDAGMTMEESLNVVGAEIDIPEFDFFVAASTAQIESGGNLAGVLENLVDLIRGREQLHQKVASLSAEGKLSAWLLCAMPPMFVVGMHFWKPDFVEPLFSTEMGNLLLWFIGFAVGIGGFISWRMTQIKV